MHPMHLFIIQDVLYSLVETIHILLPGGITTLRYKGIKAEDGCWDVLLPGELEKGSGNSGGRSW